MSKSRSASVEGPELEALLQLRTKKEQHVLKFIHAKTQVAMIFAALAEETYEETHSEKNLDYAERLLRRAEEAIAEVDQLLPMLTDDQRRNVGPQLEDLRKTLDRLGPNLEKSRSKKTASMS